MATVVFACLAGLAFGAVNVTVLRALRGGGSIDAGVFLMMIFGLAIVGVAALIGGRGGEIVPGELWPFLLIGAIVPGAAQILAAQAVQEVGASRTGVLLGTTPLASALIAIAVFAEPIQAGLVAGTILIVVGGAALSWEQERPAHFHRIGVVIALVVALLFGIRDNIVRWIGPATEAEPLVQTFVLFIGGSVAVGLYLIGRGSLDDQIMRMRASIVPFLPVALLHSLGNIFLLEAFNSGRVTVAAPLVATAALWSVVLAAAFYRTSEAIGRRVTVVALVIVVGGMLIGITR